MCIASFYFYSFWGGRFLTCCALRCKLIPHMCNKITLLWKGPVGHISSRWWSGQLSMALAHQRQVRAEAQELTWKMPGVCSSEVDLPVCETPHSPSSQLPYHPSRSLREWQGRALCIDKEMSACVIWKCVTVFIHAHSHRHAEIYMKSLSCSSGANFGLLCCMRKCLSNWR